MPSLNSKEFGEIIIKLEKLADGIDIHKTEAGFVIPKADEIRQEKTQIELFRHEYEIAENAARIKYDSYSEQISDARSLIEKSNSLILSYYGKKDQIVGDFGISPRKYVRRSESPENTEVEPN